MWSLRWPRIVWNAHPSLQKVCIVGTNAPPVIKSCVGFLFLFDFLCERNVQSQSAGSLSIIYKWNAIYVARAVPGSKSLCPKDDERAVYGVARRFMFAQQHHSADRHTGNFAPWIYWTRKNCLSVCNWKRASVHRSTCKWSKILPKCCRFNQWSYIRRVFVPRFGLLFRPG